MTDDRRTVAIAFHEPIVGGAAIAVLRVLPRLEELGWRFVFWAPGPGSLRTELEGRGYDVAGEQRLLRYSREALRVPPGTRARLGSAPGYLRRFRRWLVDTQPDVLHANTLITIPEAMTAVRTGIPVFMYVHEILPGGVRGAAAARLIRTFSDEVLTNSDASVEALRRAGVRARKAHYGIEVPEAPPRSADGDGPLVVGTLGTVSRRKGSDLFLTAARRVLSELPEVEFRMVGPRPDEAGRDWAQRIIDDAQEAGIKWSTTTDPLGELSSWDVLALPSRREPFGLVLIEAMAMRVPVVAARLDGPREIVTEDTGLLVDADDADSLARGILELARDPVRRRAMGDAGRLRVEREFGLDKQAEAVHRSYLDAAARRRRG